MKQINFVILFVLAIISLMAHPAYNAWERQKLSGNVRIMAYNPQFGGGVQKITVFAPDGKIEKCYSFMHAYGWDKTVALDYFVDRQADKMVKKWYKEAEDIDIVTTYTYASQNGRIVGCTGRDLFGKISEQTQYFYEGDELVSSVCKSQYLQTTDYWKAEPKYSQIVSYDSQGNVVDEYDDYGEADGKMEGYSYEYDLRGNTIKATMHSGDDEFDAFDCDYVYYNPIRSVSASSSRKAYPVKYLNDNDPSTTWVAGTKPDGIGDWVLLTLEDETFVTSLDYTTGFDYAKDGQDYFFLNNRLKRITITLSGGEPINYDFNGKDRKVQIPINAITSTIKITIKDVYPGSKWQDTCISELGVNTR